MTYIDVAGCERFSYNNKLVPKPKKLKKLRKKKNKATGCGGGILNIFKP